MALAAADLQQPLGRIASSFFPDDGAVALGVRLDAYLAEAYADARVVALLTTAEKDAAARAWSYYRSFQAVADRLNIEAATLELDDQGSRQRLFSQLDYWRKEAAAARADFDGLAPPLSEVLGTVTQPSASVPITFQF